MKPSLLRAVQLLPVVLGMACFCQSAKEASAELVTYDVTVLNAGPIFVGDAVNWQITATVSQSTPSNFGIATASVNLADSLGETLTPGTISAAFSDYDFRNGGNFSSGQLRLIGAAQFEQDDAIVEGMDPSNGGSLGPIVLASGSYVVTQVGTHTLSTLTNPDDNQFFTERDGFATAALTRSFGSAEFEVLAAVPEPSSLAMIGVALCGAWGVRRRRTAVA